METGHGTTVPSPPADRRARQGAAGPGLTAPGIGRGPTPGTHPNARRSPPGRRPPPPTPAAGPQQLRQLNAAWSSMRVRLPRNAIDSSRARTLNPHRGGLAAPGRPARGHHMSPPWQAQPQGRRGRRSATIVPPAQLVAAGLAGGGPLDGAGPPGGRGHEVTSPSSSAQWVSASRPSRTPGSTGMSQENRPCPLPRVRGRTDEPLWGGRPEPLLPDPGQVL